MSSNLLKCVRYQTQFSENVIFNQRRKLTNLKTMYQSDPLSHETRKTLSSSRGNVTVDKNGFQPVKKSCKIFDRIAYCRSIRKAEIENILNNVNSEDDIQTSEALVLLKCCNKIFDCLPSRRLEFIEYLWSHLSVCNVPLDVHHYNERLKLYVKIGYDFSPMDILKEMKANNICPDITTYDQCIEHYCRKGKIKCTSPLLTELSNQNMLITENMYKSLIWGYYLNGEIETALEIFGTQIENSIQKNEIYTVQMCINAEENNFYKIKEVLENCNLNNISFSNKNILNVIYRLAVNNHTKHIDEIISKLRKILPLSGDEIHIILQFIYIDRIDIAVKILLCFMDMHISKLFIQNLVSYSTDVHTILDVCNILDNNNLCENSLYWALYYSYFRDDDLCFPLLKIYQRDHTIKPHFFWPMLVRKANVYDVKGMLNILKIMINDFNVSPCVSTICNYVLPYLFGNGMEARKLLIKCGISKTIIDNAFVLIQLKELRTQNAVYYAKIYRGPYLYKYVAPEVKNALVTTEDTESLIYLSSLLVDSNYQNEDTVYNNEATHAETCLPIDKLLLEIVDDGLITKSRLKRMLIHLAEKRIKITSKTTKRVYDYVGLHMADTVQKIHKKMSSKWNKDKSSNVKDDFI